jgi:type VI secretion system Hcp family effector
MAAFIYFKDPKVKGEVTQGSFAGFSSPNGKPGKDKFYHDWIQLTSVTETVTRAIETGRSGTARARAGCVLEDIEIEKEVDKTSTALLELCSGGRAVDEVFIHLCTSIEQEDGTNESLHAYFEFHLFAVKVTSYSISLQGGDDGAIPTETISLNFDKAHWRYWPIGPIPDDLTAKANKVHSPTMAGWDVVSASRFVLPPGS